MPNQPTDFTPYLFLAAMIVIGGFVAWVADSLGRKIGKKRLSFMGLRPRYTATLLTVGAGILIPILTIAALFVLSRDVREWIQEGRGAIQRAKQYQAQAQELQGGVDDLERKQRDLTGRNEKLTNDAKALNAKIKSFQDQVRMASQRLVTAQSLTRAAQSRVSSLQGKLTLTNRQISAKTSEIASKEKALAAGKKRLVDLQSSLNTATSEYNDINQQYLKLDKETQQLEKDLQSSKSQLSTLQNLKTEYEGQIESYKQSVTDYQESIADYTKKVDDLQQEYARLSNLATSSIFAIRTKPMIYETGEEVARSQVPASLSPDAARMAFISFRAQTNQAAIERKARSNPNLDAAGFIDRQRGTPPQLVTVKEQEEAMIRSITAQRSELILVAISLFNAFEGEYVVIDVGLVRNRLVYPQGQVIAEKRIDGRKSEIEILNQIQDFVGTNVRAQAIKDGMVPPFGRSGQLGRVNESELLDLISEVKSYNQLVRVQAVAKDSTKAGDQLELAFRVRL